MSTGRDSARAWAQQVVAGDKVLPDPIWNRTERWPRQLPVPCEVLEVGPPVGASQSGLMFVVKSNGGERLCLDSSWFVPKPQQGLFG